MAALRSGAGLVTAAVPQPALALVAAAAPELMTLPLAASQAGRISAENLTAEGLAVLMAGKTVLALGPGLGQGPETVEFTRGLLAATKIPAVIDADALNILASEPEMLKALSAAGQGRADGGADAASGRDGAADGDDHCAGAGQPA